MVRLDEPVTQAPWVYKRARPALVQRTHGEAAELVRYLIASRCL